MKIRDVARLTGKSEMTIRVGLQKGVFPFGVAVKMPNSNKYTYVLFPEKVKEYIGR